MSLITFNWNLWNNLLFLWISNKTHSKLIYHFKVLWPYPAVPDQAQLIISLNVYPYKKINFMLQVFHEILDFQKLTYKTSISCINSSLSILILSNPAIWLVKSILGYNSRPRIFPVMKFGMGSQVSQ